MNESKKTWYASENISKAVKKASPHLAALLIFFALTAIFFAPVFEGKDIRQDDAIGSMGWGKDARDYHEETGEYTYWSNSMFSGMPANYTFSPQPANVFEVAENVVTLKMFGASRRHIGVIFATFVGFYIFLLALGCRSWLSIAGAIAYTFCSYNFIIIGAGHMSKSLVMATMAPVIGGIILCYRRKLALGALITLVFAGLNVYWNHQQISYYLLLTIIIMALVYLFYAVREGWLKYYLKATGVLIAVAVLAVLPAWGNLATAADYAKDSMRGGSEIKDTDGESSNGLAVDYAFQWSYGKAETLTLLVPNLYGSASAVDRSSDEEYAAELDKFFNKQKQEYRQQLINEYGNSPETLRAIEAQAMPQINRDINRQKAQILENTPAYWGPQPGTSGAVYAGAIVCVLFVLGIFIVKGPEKWWLLGATLLSFVLAWGNNFMAVNEFLFNNLPLYNKFRAPSMALVIASLTMVTLAVLAVKRIIEIKKSDDAKHGNCLKQSMYISFGIVATLLLVLALFGGSMFDFVGASDGSFPEELSSALQVTRANMLAEDAWRSLIFVALTFALMFTYLRFKFKTKYMVAALAVLLLLDLWPVCKRYLSHGDFIEKSATTEIPMSATDREILRDTDPGYRVMNFTSSTFNEAFTSYYHNSIGGYSPAKLSRYNDIIKHYYTPRFSEIYRTLIDRYSAQFEGNADTKMGIVNMLNTRYFIMQGQDGATIPLRNEDALGNCWFVNGFEWVDSPEEELAAILDFDPTDVAYIDRSWEKDFPDSEQYNNPVAEDAYIKVADYKNPGNIIYESSSPTPQLALFSEVYYKTWKAYIDGKEVKPLRANYILRALPIPAGKHTIEFRCVDELMISAHKVSLYSSIAVGIVILLLAGYIIYSGVRKKQED